MFVSQNSFATWRTAPFLPQEFSGERKKGRERNVCECGKKCRKKIDTRVQQVKEMDRMRGRGTSRWHECERGVRMIDSRIAYGQKLSLIFVWTSSHYRLKQWIVLMIRLFDECSPGLPVCVWGCSMWFSGWKRWMAWISWTKAGCYSRCDLPLVLLVIAVRLDDSVFDCWFGDRSDEAERNRLLNRDQKCSNKSLTCSLYHRQTSFPVSDLFFSEKWSAFRLDQ